MSNDETVAKPPYITWGTFEPILKRLKMRTPTTVNLEVLKKWEVSEPTGRKVLPALRFLGIIDGDGAPNTSLWQSLMATDPTKYQNAVRQMLETAYERMLNEYQNALEQNDDLLGGHLTEIYGTAPNSRQPSVAFIRGLMKEAGMQVESETKAPRSATKKPAAKPAAKAAAKTEREKIKLKVDAHPDPEDGAGNGASGQRVIHIHIHVGSDVEKIGDVIKAVIDGFENASED